MTKTKPHVSDSDWLVLGTRTLPSSYTAQEVPWGISHAARRNHLYVVGKTGMGKTATITKYYISRYLARRWGGRH